MTQKLKASRNKTIDLSVSEGEHYLNRCLSVTAPVDLDAVVDRTILGDTFEVLPYLPDQCVDLLIVDPPYNLNKTFEQTSFHETSDQAYADYTERWIQSVVPLLKPTASIYVCCDWKSGIAIGPVLQRYFKIQNRITWQREKGRSAAHNWKNGMEDIWFATVSDSYTFHADAVKIRRKVIAPYKENGMPKDWEETEEGNYRNTGASNFWDDITIPYWSMAENTAHPTQKPEKLLAKLILASTNEGDVVLDPFLGSGSVSVTAKKLNRHYIGIEREAQYAVWAEKRLDLANTDRTIQGYADGVFWERNTSALQKKKK